MSVRSVNFIIIILFKAGLYHTNFKQTGKPVSTTLHAFFDTTKMPVSPSIITLNHRWVNKELVSHEHVISKSSACALSNNRLSIKYQERQVSQSISSKLVTRLTSVVNLVTPGA